MVLSLDNKYLVSGTDEGTIYIWDTNKKELYKNLELHKGKGAIMGLRAIERPIHLYGLNANVKAFGVESV